MLQRHPILSLSTGLFFSAALTLVTAPELVAQQPRDSATADDSIRQTATVLDPLVVTAERRPTRASDATAAVRVLSTTEIARLGATDLTAVLRDVPGVQVDPVVGSGAGVMLQGLGSDRVLILIDGSPAVGRIGGEFDLTRLDPSMFESIEIVEGPQSTLYGSNALGGVVNLITRTNRGSRLEASTTVGSKGQLDGRGKVSGLFGTWGGSAELGRRTLDVAPGTGPTTLGFANRWDGMARGQAAVGRANLDIRAMGLKENQQYRTGATAQNINYNDNWQLDGLAQLSVGATELRAHVSGYDHRFASGPSTGAPGAPDWDRQRVFDVEGLQHGTAGRARWLAGAKGEREWIRADRVAGGDERGGWTGAGYASVELPLGSFVQLSTGARLTASEEWGTNATPRAGLLLRSTHGLYAKGGIARGFRAPSFKDLYTDFLNTTAFYRITGNASLVPETSWNVTGEVGFTNRLVRLYGRGYSNWLRDFIQSVQTGVSPGGILMLEYRNVGKALTRGLEVGGSASQSIVELSGAYAFLDAEDAATNLNLAGRAQHTARGALTVSPGPLSLRGEANYSGKVLISRTTAGAETFQGSYTRFNASLIANLPLGLRATLGGENITNAIPDRALTALGRRWHAGLTWGGGW